MTELRPEPFLRSQRVPAELRRVCSSSQTLAIASWLSREAPERICHRVPPRQQSSRKDVAMAPLYVAPPTSHGSARPAITHFDMYYREL